MKEDFICKPVREERQDSCWQYWTWRNWLPRGTCIIEIVQLRYGGKFACLDILYQPWNSVGMEFGSENCHVQSTNWLALRGKGSVE